MSAHPHGASLSQAQAIQSTLQHIVRPDPARDEVRIELPEHLQVREREDVLSHADKISGGDPLEEHPRCWSVQHVTGANSRVKESMLVWVRLGKGFSGIRGGSLQPVVRPLHARLDLRGHVSLSCFCSISFFNILLSIIKSTLSKCVALVILVYNQFLVT